MSLLRTLVVDDSLIYRQVIKQALLEISGIEVVGQAANGKEALAFLQQHAVDLVTLDLEMPELDGLGVLRALQRLKMPLKVLVFSSISKAGAAATLEALALGAQDYVLKPASLQTGDSPKQSVQKALLPVLRQFWPHLGAPLSAPVATSLTTPPSAPPMPKKVVAWSSFTPDMVVMGASTGGPTALEAVLSKLDKAPVCPIVIVQHMPPLFTASLAERLSQACKLPVREAQQQEVARAGHIYVAPGNYHVRLKASSAGTMLVLDQSPPINFVRPAVDPLFQTAAQLFGKRCLAMVLTGMGVDGCAGAVAVQRADGVVLIQDAASCAVFGMPKAVYEAGAYVEMSPLSGLAARLRHAVCR